MGCEAARLGADARSRGAFAIETEAYQRGVPMARPVPASDGRCWATIDDHVYRCHEWVEGEAKRNEESSVREAGAMGAIVAQLHGLRIPCSVEGRGPQRERTSRQHWDEAAGYPPPESATPCGRTGYTTPARHSAYSRTSLARPSKGKGSLSAATGISNADNVLFSSSALRLIDWDGAGPAWPRWERANYAVLWAQRGHGRYDPESVIAFLRGYLDGGGTLEVDDPIALQCASAALVPWVVQNIGMALDRPTPQQDVLTGLLINALLAMPRTIAVRQALLQECLGRL